MLAGLCAAGALRAQEAELLLPDCFTASVGGSLELRVESPAGLAAPWPGERLEWLFWRVGGLQENRDTLLPRAPGGQTVAVPLAASGVAMLGYDARPRIVAVRADGLRAFLAGRTGERADAALRALDPQSLVRVRSSAKTLVRVFGAAGELMPSSVATSKSGQAGEIRTWIDPTALRAGSDLPVEVHLSGAGRATLLAWPASRALAALVRPGPDGAARVRIDAKGVWILEAHAARRLPADPDADWEIASATLTFEVVR